MVNGSNQSTEVSKMFKEHFSIDLEADLLVKYQKWIQIMFRFLPKSSVLLFGYLNKVD